MESLYEHLKAEHSETVPPEVMAEVEKVKNFEANRNFPKKKIVSIERLAKNENDLSIL